MTTVAEIEHAIEQLPAPQITELAAWVEDCQLMLSASTDVFMMLEEEEGGVEQWQEPSQPGAKSGS
jgi:hypothetical protein